MRLRLAIQNRHLMPAPVDRTSEYLVVQTPMDDRSKHKPSTSMTQVALGIKATFSCQVIRASMPRKLVGSRAYGRVLCPDISCRN